MYIHFLPKLRIWGSKVILHYHGNWSDQKNSYGFIYLYFKFGTEFSKNSEVTALKLGS